MKFEAHLPLDEQLTLRRRAAAAKAGFARALQRHADSLRREAEREMQEIEIAERVLRDLPTTPSDALDLERKTSPDWLWQEAQKIASAELTNLQTAAAGTHDTTSANRSEVAPAASSVRDMVISVCAELLKGGRWSSTEELYRRLDAMGVQLRVLNPVQRVSQILSADSRFKSQRGRGWSLATDEDRKDEWEQKLERRSNELLDKDNSAR